jgi:DNA-binding transcriptional MerR regulator/effector-binding domain-containing protein
VRVNGTLSIGDFSKATQLSVKTLRHYHGVGLLIPAHVDSSSGYRRYTTDQIQVAQVIRRFRDLDMPLGQIADVLGATDPAFRSELIAEHLERLERELVDTQSAVASLRNLLQGPADVPTIAHRSDPAFETAAVSDCIELADLSAWFQGAVAEVHATLAAQHITVMGPGGAVVSDGFFADEAGEITVFVPAATPVIPVGRVVHHVLPPAELAVIVHEGSHAGIDRSYGALATHVAERAIAVDGPIRERYLVSRHDTNDEKQWRTEIGWPIFRTTLT